MPTLKQLRDEIKKVDTAIIKSLAKRQQIAFKIGKIKANKGKQIHNAKREEYLMRYYKKLCRTYKLQELFIEKIFTNILSHSRRLQKK